MNKKWVITTLVIAVVAFLLHPQVFPPPAHSMPPTQTQLPFLIFLTVLESVALGLGISFYLFGYPLVKKGSITRKNLAAAVYLSIGWILINWWFHDGLHMINGMDIQGLLYIEYLFHVTLIASGAILAYAFFHLLNTKKSA